MFICSLFCALLLFVCFGLVLQWILADRCFCFLGFCLFGYCADFVFYFFFFFLFLVFGVFMLFCFFSFFFCFFGFLFLYLPLAAIFCSVTGFFFLFFVDIYFFVLLLPVDSGSEQNKKKCVGSFVVCHIVAQGG